METFFSIAAGCMAGLVQASTVALRMKSSLATGGTGNPIFSTFELGGSIVTALLAIFIPILCLILIVLFFIWVVRKTESYYSEKIKQKKICNYFSFDNFNKRLGLKYVALFKAWILFYRAQTTVQQRRGFSPNAQQS